MTDFFSSLLSSSPRKRGLLPAALVAAGAVAATVVVWQPWHTSTSWPAPPAKAAARITSLAVKPLDDFSADRSQAYLSDGMTEALCAALGGVSSLRVPGRTSVMRFKGSQTSIQEIARELNVDAIVEGSVQLAGQRMLITVKLVEAATDRHLWAKDFECDLADFFQVQREVARAVTSEISARLTPQEQRRLSEVRALNPEAIGAYLKGVHFGNQWTREGTTAAMEQLERAIRLEPDFAAAHAALAHTCITAAYLTMRPVDALRKADDAAQQAVRADPNSADAFAALAAAKLHLRDWAGTEDALRRALALNPRHAMAHDWNAWYLAARGRTGEAVAQMRRALEMEPQSILFNPDMAYILLYAGRYAEAATQSEEALRLDRGNFQAHETLGWARILQGDYQAGIKTLFAAQQLDDSWSVRAQLTRAYARAGNSSEAAKQLSELLRSPQTGEKSLSADILAQVYAALGENAKALECLERAVEDYGPRAIWVLVDWELVKLRDEPRYALLIEKLGLDR